MSKANANLPVFRRSAVAAEVPASAARPLVLSRPESQLTHDEKRVARETRLQLAVLDGQLVKTAYGLQIADALHQSADSIFYRGSAMMLTRKDRGVSDEHRAVLHERAKLALADYDQDLSTIVRAGVQGVINVIARPLYPEDEERGWFPQTYEKLFK
jgi:hypothetical protein